MDETPADEQAEAKRPWGTATEICDAYKGDAMGIARELVARTAEAEAVHAELERLRAEVSLLLTELSRLDDLYDARGAELERLHAERREAAQTLRAVGKAALVVKTTLDKPYPDDPSQTPWTRFMEAPARAAYNLGERLSR